MCVLYRSRTAPCPPDPSSNPTSMDRSPKCNMTVLTQTPATSYTHIHTHTHTRIPAQTQWTLFYPKSSSHANRVGRQDPHSAYLSREGGLRRDRQRGPPLLFWLGLRDGGAGMDLGVGWEWETPTMPQSPPLLFLLMSMTRSDRAGTDLEWRGMDWRHNITKI